MGVSALEDVARLHQMWEVEFMFLGIHCQPNFCICGEIYCGLKEKEIQDNMIREEGEKERNRADDGHGYNSPVLNADSHASAQYATNFSEAYPGEALANLNAWPAEAPWYADIRTEYVNKFKSS